MNNNNFIQTLESVPYYSPWLIQKFIEITENIRPVSSQVKEIYGIELEAALNLVEKYVQEGNWVCEFHQIDRSIHKKLLRTAFFVYTATRGKSSICLYIYFNDNALETDTSEENTQIGVNFHVGAECDETFKMDFDKQITNLFEELQDTVSYTHDNVIYLLEKTFNSGAKLVHKEITMPDMDSLLQNYPNKIRAKVEKLLTAKPRDLKKGKLTILNGIAGSGKSNLIRGLASAWHDWAELVYITDTEEFFNDSRFFRSVLTEIGKRFSVNNKTVVLIIEDADMYISTEAKILQGSVVSRLLNVCDGILGDALNIMFILTANEQGETIHAAFARPGRCLHHITFETFPYDEAVEWAKFMDMDPELLPKGACLTQVGFNTKTAKGDPLSLAEMYQTYRSQEIEEEEE